MFIAISYLQSPKNVSGDVIPFEKGVLYVYVGVENLLRTICKGYKAILGTYSY